MSPEKILLLRALPGLGDMLCITPTLAALRSNYPDSQITLIGLEWAEGWARRYTDYLDRFIKFPGFPGMTQGWRSDNFFVDFLNEAIEENYDLALQVHGSGSISNYFVDLLGAKLTAGFYTPPYYCPNPDTFLTWEDEESESGRYHRLLRHLNIQVKDKGLIFPMTRQDELEFEALRRKDLATDKPIAIIHPGASSILRICPMEVFARIALFLENMGFYVVLTGVENEEIYTREISRLTAASVVDLAGKTSLGCLGQLIKHSSIVICNDTGISHMADSTKTKSVVIFMENPPSRWAPLDDSLHRVVDVREFDFNHFPVQETVVRILEEVKLLLD